MNDREYVKLNTSINTASNSDHLIRNEEGQIEATIELSLPANLFDSDSHTRKIEKVEMQTSKMRLSLETTPIAQIPMDMEVSTENIKAAQCQLDVYPYCLLDDNRIAPDPNDASATLAFPKYKSHKATIQIFVYPEYGSPLPPGDVVTTYLMQPNTTGYDFVPSTSRFYDLLKKAKINQVTNHMMNMCAQSNHEPYKIENDSLMIANIGTLEQMFQDALENAISFASMEDEQHIIVHLVPVDWTANLSPLQDRTNTVFIPEYNKTFCYWKWSRDDTTLSISSDLVYGCKPSVRFDAQSLSISYDTAAFGSIIPIFWNPPFVETYDHPEQMTLDTIRNMVWSQPPPKRMYKYGASIAAESPNTYAYTVLQNLKCAAMNLIVNRAFRDSFSFLPWIKVDTKLVSDFQEYATPLPYHIDVTVTTSQKIKMVDPTFSFLTYYYVEQGQATEPVVPYQYILQRSTGVEIDDHYIIGYEFEVLPEHEEALVGNNYAYRKRQKTTYGRMYTGAVVGTAENPAYMPTTCAPMNGSILSDTTSNPQVVESYDTAFSTYNLGPTLETDSNPTNVEISNLLLPANPEHTPGRPRYFERYLCFYDLNENNEREFQLGVIPQGEWLDEVTDEGRMIPPRALDNDTVTQVERDGVTYNKHTGYWFVPKAAEMGGTQWYYARYTKIQVYASYTENTTDSYERLTESTYTSFPPPPTPTALKILPNLDVTNKEFYVLDGTSAEISIGPQELIPGGGETHRIGSRVTEVTTTVDQQRTETITSSGGAIDPETFLPIRDATLNRYEAAMSAYEIHAIYDPDASPLVIEFYRGGDALLHIKEEIVSPASSQDSISAWETVNTTENTTTEVLDNPTLPTGTTTEQNEDASSGPLTGEIQDLSSETFYINETEEQGGRHNLLVPGTTDLNVLNLVPGATCVWASSVFSRFVPVHEPAYVVTDTVEQSTRIALQVVWNLSQPEEWDNPKQGNFTRTESASAVATRDETRQIQTIVTTTEAVDSEATPDVGNLRLTYIWNNLPMVVMSPIQSIVLTLQGVRVAQEYQPINRTEVGGSTLTSSIPVIENFYSMAQTLRDLHDELVVVKDTFDDTATYGLDPEGGMQRTLVLSAKYITKDGRLHQIYIPPNGVFSLQLTFGVSFYTV